MAKILSVVVPVYNEEANIPLIHQALKKVMKQTALKYEFIFVNDGSKDSSLTELEKIAKKDKNVHIIDLARNFGKEIATTAGLHTATGHAAIMIDADLQHPVELIPEFIAKWQDGADVVVGVRASYGKESFLKKANSWLFYKFFNSISETKTTPHATDYRLIDRAVIDEFTRFTERSRITRGLIDWLGFRREYIYFTAAERANGVASYSFFKLIKLALNTFVSHSLFPLRAAGWLGIFITIIASVLMIFVIIERFMLHDPLHLYISGTAILADLNVLLIGVVLVSLGLIALYVGSIHDQSLNRPLYVIRERSSVLPRSSQEARKGTRTAKQKTPKK